MIVAVASRKASPGVTSLTVWLAQFWSEPAVTRLVVEADPAGGSLAARWSAAHRLTWDPGLITLSTTRAPLSAALLPTLTQRLADRLLVAAAPPVPDQVIGGLTRWGDRGPAELAGLDGVRAFVDCGRLTASSPALALARRAVLTILVCRPRLDEVNALVPAVAELAAAGCTPALVCVGHEPYQPAEIAAAAGVGLLGVLPVDPRAAAAFDRDGLDAGRAFRRSPLALAVAELTELVRARCAELARPQSGGSSGGPPAQHLAAPDPGPVAIPVSPAIAAARARMGEHGTGSGAPASWPPPAPVGQRGGPAPV